MNKLKIITACLLGLLLTASCNNFLTVKPRDTRVMQNIEDYRDLLGSYMRLLTNITNVNQQAVFGQAYLYPKFDMAFELGLNTGETVLSKQQGSYYDKKEGIYTEYGKQLMSWFNPNESVWNRYYSFLGPINLILAEIDGAEGHQENLRHIVKGEALVWRAYSYFKLLQYYAPYRDNQYGIPVYLKPYEDVGTAMPSRLTQKEVYRQISEDCQSALDLLKLTPSNSWNFAWKTDFIHAMMAAVYFYKAGSGAGENGDWQLAADYAGKAMEGRELTDDPAVLREMFNGGQVKEYICDEAYIRIVDGTGGYVLNYRKAYCSSVLQVEPVSSEYKTKYRNDDIRKSVYFSTVSGEFLADKYSLNNVYVDGGGVWMPFRLAEMYLIRAEALVMTEQLGMAENLLTDFRAKRYLEPINVPAEREKLLQEIRKERELEFFEENDFRWLDMKRLGIRLERVVNGEDQVLEPDDFRYTFPIPREELKLNRNMVQNPGWEKVIY